LCFAYRFSSVLSHPLHHPLHSKSLAGKLILENWRSLNRHFEVPLIQNRLPDQEGFCLSYIYLVSLILYNRYSLFIYFLLFYFSFDLSLHHVYLTTLFYFSDFILYLYLLPHLLFVYLLSFTYLYLSVWWKRNLCFWFQLCTLPYFWFKPCISFTLLFFIYFTMFQELLYCTDRTSATQLWSSAY
jgi:hypothetical protein